MGALDGVLRRGLVVVTGGLIVVAGSGLAACSLLSDFDELSSGGVGGGGREDDGGAGESGADGSAETGPSSPDDGGQEADAPGGTWCTRLSPQPRTCLDFDDGDLTSLNRVLSAGALALEASGSSAPNALLASIDDATAGSAYASFSLGTTPPTRVRWSFEIRVDEAGDLIEFGELRFAYDENGFCAIQPSRDGNQLQVNQYCEDVDGTPLQRNHTAINVGGTPGYYRFSMDVDLVARKLVADVRRPEGTNEGISATLDPRVVAGRAEVRAGISWAPARTPGVRVRMDNFTLDWD